MLAILDKMTKQRKDSLEQYQNAGRDDLAEQEQFELTVIDEYTPEALSDAEIEALVKEAVAETGATSMRDMGAPHGKSATCYKEQIWVPSVSW